MRRHRTEPRKIFITTGKRFSANPPAKKKILWVFQIFFFPHQREAQYHPHPATRGKFPSHFPEFSLISSHPPPSFDRGFSPLCLSTLQFLRIARGRISPHYRDVYLFSASPITRSPPSYTSFYSCPHFLPPLLKIRNCPLNTVKNYCPQFFIFPAKILCHLHIFAGRGQCHSRGNCRFGSSCRRILSFRSRPCAPL